MNTNRRYERKLAGLERNRLRACTTAGACLLGILIAPAPAWADGVFLVSESYSPGRTGNFLSGRAEISGDGLYVVFESKAYNLITGDTNGTWDVFVYEVSTGELQRVSLTDSGEQGAGASRLPSISDDGRYVAFLSWAYNLVPGDDNSAPDVFVRDLVAETTQRVSVHSAGTQASDWSWGPAISGDGAIVAFTSWADNLVDNDNNAIGDAFVHDLVTGQTARISVDSSGVEGNDYSGGKGLSLSQDGRFVAFCSLADNLVADDDNNSWDVFVRDRLLSTTERVSTDSTGIEGSDHSWYPSISADGRYVAFWSSAGNLVPDDTNDADDVFVHDRQTGVTERVSVDSAGDQGNDHSRYPSISADGLWVAFQSTAADLVVDDTNGVEDIFLHNRTESTTLRVSLNADEEQADGACARGDVSGDGQYVAFETLATNFGFEDYNDAEDVYLRFLGEIQPCPGDFNGDLFRNITDFTLFAEAYPSQVGDPNYDPEMDMNSDGFINLTDFSIFANYYGIPCV